MNKNFTRNSLVRYLYKETSLNESIDITDLLSGNPDLRAEFDTMAELKSQLDIIRHKPAKKTIDRILAYSRNHMIEA